MAAQVHAPHCSDNCLQINIGCQLFIEIKGVRERQKSNLVGVVPGSFLIVTKPQMAGFRNLLKQENKVLVRYLCMGEVFGFESRSIGMISVPYPLLFLSYPAVFERINLRKGPRISCYLPAAIRFKRAMAEAMIVDISRDGCRISVRSDASSADPEIDLDDAVQLAFPLLGSQGNVEVRGIVRNYKKDHQIITVGIQFQDLSGEIIDRIERYTRKVLEFSEA